MVIVRPDLIHDAYVDPLAPAMRALPAPKREEAPADALAEPVWVSVGVEGYHTSSQCSTLLSDLVTRSRTEVRPFRMARSDAEESGLSICKWCRAWQQML